MTDDQSRLVATTDETKYSLSVDEAAECYAHAGHPPTAAGWKRNSERNTSSRPRPCAKHIAYIEEVRPVTTGRDQSRQAATVVATEILDDATKIERTTSDDRSRPVATSPDESRYVAALERENEFLRGQIGVKDTQIGELHAARSLFPLQWITKIWALFRLPFAQTSLVAVAKPKETPPTSESSEMSNKIARVSLDFSGAARMCAGSKGVDADGPAVS
jgi:hypothetical protein